MRTSQKAGLVIAGLYSLANVPSAVVPSPSDGPSAPFFILVIGSILGVVGLVAVVAAWRGSALAARVAAGAIIVMTLTGLPALFVDGIPAAIRALVGLSVLVTVVAIYLMFSPDRDRQPAGVLS